jgi:hypothetical protein
MDNDWFAPYQALLTAHDLQIIERYRHILVSSENAPVYIKPFQEMLKEKQTIGWGENPPSFTVAAEYSGLMAAILAKLLGIKNDEWEYTRTKHGSTLLAKLGIYGFAHPSAVREIGDKLKERGVETLLDLCAGSGFLAMMFTAIGHFKVIAFDKAPPVTGIAPHAALLYPVICHTDYQTIHLESYDWNRTALCLSWSDKPGDPVISLGILEKALKAGVRYLLINTDHELAFTASFEAKCRKFFEPISEEFYATAGLEKTMNCYTQLYILK